MGVMCLRGGQRLKRAQDYGAVIREIAATKGRAVIKKRAAIAGIALGKGRAMTKGTSTPSRQPRLAPS